MKNQEAKKLLGQLIKSGKRPNYQLSEKYTDVIIYGAGSNGKVMQKLLEDLGINVIVFLDINANNLQKINNIPVELPESPNITDSAKQYTVLLALDKFKHDINEIQVYLKSLGYKDIVYNHNILCRASLYHLDKLYNLSTIDFELEEKNILQGLDLLADEMSRKIFVDFLRARITSDFEDTIVNDQLIACAKVDVPFSKGYANFIDCGAYTGDTFKDVIKNHKEFNTYVAFEPTLNTFEKLNFTVNAHRDFYKTAYLYPLGVADKNCYVQFEDELDGANVISEDGKNTILTVKIDDIIKNLAPTMIKMDIEGAEISALKGAKQTIIKYQPDLSICVYHKTDDLWKIPLLLHEWVSDYKFYLRCHNVGTSETILYATVPNINQVRCF